MRKTDATSLGAMRPFPVDRTRPDRHSDTDELFSALSRDARSPVWDAQSRLAGGLPATRDTDEIPANISRGGRRTSRFRRAHGGALGVSGSARPHAGLRFDLKVDAGGYAWWYVDALSDDGAFGLTMIAFVGSVFSPYYAWSGRGKPDNHCALNVALYGPRAARWSMTERGASRVTRSPDRFDISKSALSWSGDTLTISVDEICAPLPRRLRGEIRIRTEGLGDDVFLIDDRGRHRWRPLSPFSRVEVDFNEPDLHWAGHGYFDANEGDEPLEDAFQYWDWSRTILDDKKTAILYNTDMRNGETRSAALLVDRRGDIRDMAELPPAQLPATPVFRIPRRTRSETAQAARIVKTLEDTPFYSRSIIESRLFGETRPAIHESLEGPRLRSSLVRMLLPFRMPRIA